MKKHVQDEITGTLTPVHNLYLVQVSKNNTVNKFEIFKQITA